MEAEKISEICIKPSSPTPPHLKIYKISLLDQSFAQSIEIPMILYYSNKDINLTSEMSMLLKQSLSETLTYYYPLAGRIKDSLSIDCNDEGLAYVEARAKISLSKFLSKPDLPLLNSLLPRKDKWYDASASRFYAMMIQETIFECGSIAIGLLVSHMVMDGTATASFLNCWAAIARKSSEHIIPPSFDGPSIFPQDEAYPEDPNFHFPGPFLRTGKYASRRFVFDANAIANLKAKAITSRVENPTRVQVVSALVLECISDILKQASSGFDRPMAFTHLVNLRQRATPPIPQASLGNFLHIAPGLCSPEEIKIPELVYKQREAIRKIDSLFVEDIKSGGFEKLGEMTNKIIGYVSGSENGLNYLFISSWCNFGLYEVDFGWGKPAWVSNTGFPSSSSATPFLNLIILMDSPMDKGIEAWVFLDDMELHLLEQHKLLLEYASLNPSPLKIEE